MSDGAYRRLNNNNNPAPRRRAGGAFQMVGADGGFFPHLSQGANYAMTALVVVAGLAILGVAIGALVLSVQNRDKNDEIKTLIMEHDAPSKRSISSGGRNVHQARDHEPSNFDVIINELYQLTNTPLKKKIKCGKHNIDEDNPCYDVIIVGGGTAGSVLARKLTDAPHQHSVFVVEAGDDDWDTDFDNNPNTTDFVLQRADADPCSVTNRLCHLDLSGPEPGFAAVDFLFAGGAHKEFSNGRTFGGGSAINNMIAVRGTKGYWDSVSGFIISGDPGAAEAALWNGENMHALMQAQENYRPRDGDTADVSRGTGGPWSLANRPVNGTTSGFSDWLTTLAEGYATGGSPYTNFPAAPIDDYNAKSATFGVFAGYQFQNQHEDLTTFVRESADRAFLGPDVLSRTTYAGVDGRPIKVQLRATVKSLIWNPFDPTHCVGVEYSVHDNGVTQTKYAFASKSVVLSANIKTPAILQREGIRGGSGFIPGDLPQARVLNEHVGKHLKTHFITPFTFINSNVDALPQGDAFGSSNSFGIMGGLMVPDPLDPAGLGATRRGAQLYVFKPPFLGNTTDILLIQLADQASEGSIRITSTDPEMPPDVVVNALWNGLPPFGGGAPSTDLERIRKIAQEFFSRTGTAAAVLDFTTGGLLDMTNDTAVDSYIRSSTSYAHHWTGMSRMAGCSDGPGGGVVNPRTRVFGTKGLRVCDVGILPVPPDGNTATPAVAVGERCSQFLIQDIALGDAMDIILPNGSGQYCVV